MKEGTMKRRPFTVLTLCILSLLLSVSVYAKGPKAKPFIPDIPKQWTAIDPLEEYPDFTYNNLTPSCAA
jgi:hypothetical protein